MRRAAVFAFAALAMCVACVLCGCFGIAPERTVAATVNGEDIYEDEVTSYIEGFRLKNTAYETDAGWAAFLRESGYTAETMRRYVLDTNFIPRTVILQECEQRNIDISDTELDNVLARERAFYEQRYGENSWESVLASYGYDEDTWRENEALRLLEEELSNTVIKEYAPTDAEVQAEANESAANYNGKHSYYLNFANEKAASDARKKVSFNKSGKTNLDGFKKAGKPVDAGWSSLVSDRDALSNEYVTALNELDAGQVSDPIGQDGSFVLIFCDKVFSVAADKGYVALSSIPAPIREQIKLDAQEHKKQMLFDQWLDDRIDESDITYNAMPADLPYDSNVALF